LKNTQIPNFVKVRLVAELFTADGRTDGQTWRSS